MADDFPDKPATTKVEPWEQLIQKAQMSDVVHRLRSMTERDAKEFPWTFDSTFEQAADEIEKLRSALHGMRALVEQRHQVVAALANCFPSGVVVTSASEPDWYGYVYIELPTGQVSWHFDETQAHIFAHLPPYQGEWDGHDKHETYRRLAAYYLG